MSKITNDGLTNSGRQRVNGFDGYYINCQHLLRG